MHPSQVGRKGVSTLLRMRYGAAVVACATLFLADERGAWAKSLRQQHGIQHAERRALAISLRQQDGARRAGGGVAIAATEATEASVPAAEANIGHSGTLDGSQVAQAARVLVSGQNPFTADFAAMHPRSSGGPYWEFGTCTSSAAWDVPNFGARWPLITGMVSWYDRIDVSADVAKTEDEKMDSEDSGSGSDTADISNAGDGVENGDTVAFVPRTVYAVLNQAHLSIFDTSHDAEVCNKPNHVIDVSDMRSAGRGGEPVLITQQTAELQDGQSPSFCVHLQIANPNGPVPLSQIFCMPDRRARSDFIAFLTNVIEGLRDDKKFAESAGAVSGSSVSSGTSRSSVVTRDPNLFRQPPRTICQSAHPARLCLTSVTLDVAGEQSGVDDSAVSTCCKAPTARCQACMQGVSLIDYCKGLKSMEGCEPAVIAKLNEQDEMNKRTKELKSHADPAEMLDGIELRPTRWISSFPVRASKEQTWSVSGVSDAGTVTICHGHKGGSSTTTTSGNMCISVRKSVEIQGTVDLPVKKFTTCPGEDIRCFEVDDVKESKIPSAHDTDACHKACEGDKDCKGWVQTRPEAEKFRKAKCCLKKEDTSSKCKADRCCDAHMKSMKKFGMVKIDPAETTEDAPLFGVVQLAEKVRKCCHILSSHLIAAWYLFLIVT